MLSRGMFPAVILMPKEDMKNFYLDNEYSEESDNSEDYIKGD